MGEGTPSPNDLTGYPRRARERQGRFVRHIAVAVGPAETRAVLEDDFHHFRTTVRTADGRVTGVDGEALRFPWTTCGQAGGALTALVGLQVAASAPAVLAQVDPGLQCTHLLELVALAIAVAGRGRAGAARPLDGHRCGFRRPPPGRRGTRRRGGAGLDATEWRDRGTGALWGRPLGRGFSAWAVQTLAPAEAEAAVLLRRAVHISSGRSVDLDAMERPFRVVLVLHPLQPRIFDARRVKGSARDFSEADIRPPARTRTG